MKDDIALLATVTLLGVLLQGDLSTQDLPRVTAAHHRTTRVRAHLSSPGRRPCAAWSTCSRASATSRATRAPRSSGENWGVAPRKGIGTGERQLVVAGSPRGWKQLVADRALLVTGRRGLGGGGGPKSVGDGGRAGVGCGRATAPSPSPR
ncbi:leukotriene C4 synthase isoform X2 [Loxodonta africana]|uniref:leukotriene C4 synthase isoform X2 n=1 Tax=Loxodonta africana TaxID=9785 RepID=UPI0030CB49D2